MFKLDLQKAKEPEIKLEHLLDHRKSKRIPEKHLWLCGLVAKSCPTLVTPGTIASQASLSMGSSRPEYWSRLPFPSPGDLPDPGIESGFPALQAGSFPTEL